MDLQQFRELFAQTPDRFPFQLHRRHPAAFEKLLCHWDVPIEMDSLFGKLASRSGKPGEGLSEDVKIEIEYLRGIYRSWRDEQRPFAPQHTLHALSAEALPEAMKRVRPPVPEVVAAMQQAFEFVRSDRTEIPSLLAQKGLTVDQRDVDGVSSLMVCAQRGSEKSAVALIKAGANPHVVDLMGNTALHWAVIQNKRRMAELLLYFGANPNHLNALGSSPFAVSCIKEDSGMMQRLYEYKGDIASQDAGGNSPLHKAVGAESVENVWLLLVAGAAFAARNKSGATPLEMAQKNAGLTRLWDMHQTWIKQPVA